MREILFKAKRTDNGEWVEGHLIQSNYMGCVRSWISSPNDKTRLRTIATNYCDWRAVEVDTDTICQYTGLKDKNGNKIWEGDVVKCNYNNYGEKGVYVGKVIFREDNCMFVVTNGKSTDYEWWNEEKEVIGNIFDNADLLGE